MDIDEELNRIIFKYHLDKYYPHYRNMYEAKKIIQAVVQKIKDSKKRVIFVGENRQAIEFVQNIVGNYEDIRFLQYDQKDMAMHALERVSWREYEEVWILSFYGAEHVKRWFRVHNIACRWIYNVFEENNVFLQKEFFVLGQKDMYVLFDADRKLHTYSGYEGNLQCELYCQKCTYENAHDSRLKRIALEKCLFLSLYMKNFVSAREYVQLLSEEDKIQCLWKEVQELLEIIKGCLKKRHQKDIVMYWMDSLGYGKETDMPYLQKMMDKSVVFENAYTCMVYTNPTLRTLFLGKKDLDDGVYNVMDIGLENSPVMQFLNEEGYDIKIISGSIQKFFPAKCASNHFYQLYDPASMKLWDLISNVLSQERKTLYIVHCMEAHHPFLSSKMGDGNYKDPDVRYKLSKQEMDEQLAFYDGFLHEDAYRIYMSDHGYGPYSQHVLFNIYHTSLVPRRIEGMFSYLDFCKVIKQLVKNGSITESEFVKQYVEIGYMDYYNIRDIGRLFRRKGMPSLKLFGFVGILDKEYMYLHYSMGREWLQKRSEKPEETLSLFYESGSDICEPERLSYYRQLAGKYPESMRKDEKFRYTRYVYDLYSNIMMRHNSHIQKCQDILNKLLHRYPEKSIGIRMGGCHSERLYYLLAKDSRQKIYGFIDNSDECACSKYHLPIVRPDQTEKLKNAGVKAILLSSYDRLEALREESEFWRQDFDILDIYEVFEQSGIPCEDNFYKVKVSDEDYDVGFPFDEIGE